MSELTPELAAPILEACKAGADEAAGALERALGGAFKLTVGEATPLVMEPAGFDGAALALLLQVGDNGIAVVLPSASGLVPEWCSKPDASGESRLATLAQELSMLLLPESIEVTASSARVVEDLSAAVKRAHPSASATLLPIEIVSGEKSTQLSMVWPLEAPGDLFATPLAASATKSAGPVKGKSEAQAQGLESAQPRDLGSLPNYLRSLLKISVPVSVQLASKKESVQEVVGLAPGSIIKFEKGCEELLQIIAGEHLIAEGEAVKIGEKFGVRVISMTMPPEHFVPVKKKAQQRKRA